MPAPIGTQWYVKWSHLGGAWQGSVDGPFPKNEAPTQGIIKVGGKTYPLITGPYPSEAVAAAYIDSHKNGPPPESTTNIKLPSVPNPFGFLGWLEGVQHWLGIMVAALTDIHTYISLGWATLGLVLLVLGLWWWFRSTDMGKNFAQTAKETFAAGAAAA